MEKINQIIYLENSTKIKIINNFHSLIVFYCLFGGIIPSQRIYLIWLLPTIQFQFLINDNMCILTQLENRYIKNVPSAKQSQSCIGTKLAEYNIKIQEKTTDQLIYGILYLSFVVNYLMI